MVFYIIGLGLGNEKDISIKGYEVLQNCEQIYLEAYTSILGVNKQKLEEFYKKPIIEADRETCETGIDHILETLARENPLKNVAFLVVGDPFCATTHSDIFLRAIKLGLKVEVVHNASIVNAVGCTGLQVYRFGEVVSLPFFTEKWRPYSFYQKIVQNRKSNLHTLVLLDIKVKERSDINILKDKKIYEPPRYMDTQIAVQQLIEAEEQLKSEGYHMDTKCVAVARVGQSDQKIVSGKLSQFLQIEMGPPLHSFIICAEEMHVIEQEMFEFYQCEQQQSSSQQQQEVQQQQQQQNSE